MRRESLIATVAFFISGHGFGHASRQVEIINALLAGPAAPRVIVRSSADPSLFARTIRGPYTLLQGPCDPGIVQTDSVTHDDEASVDAIRWFYAAFEQRVDAEIAQFLANPPDLVIGDIPPLAFVAAARWGVPSVAIANFTWDWIYEAMPGIVNQSPDVLAVIRAAYREATQGWALPFSGGFDVFPRRQPIPLVARHASHSAAETRARLGLPLHGRVALLSFGGYGLPAITAKSVAGLRDWTIVTTDRTHRDSSASGGLVTIPESIFVETPIRYEDLVGAVDVVITKPGYGIIAECAANDTALVYTSRGAFREYDLLVEEMPGYVRCAFLSQEDLRAGRWRDAIDTALGAPPPVVPRTDGAEVAAGLITGMLPAHAR